MPPDELTRAVTDELRSASPFPPTPIVASHNLRVDLGLTDDLKRSLAPPFKRIARRFNGSADVSMDECEDLKTVKDAVSLVSTKAGFEG